MFSSFTSEANPGDVEDAGVAMDTDTDVNMDMANRVEVVNVGLHGDNKEGGSSTSCELTAQN